MRQRHVPREAPRAIVFDMDGLMIDSESVYWAAGRQIASRRGTARR